MRQKVGFIFLHTLLMCTLYSCKSDNTANTAFDDKIILIENNPQQYLARIDTIRPNSVNDEKEATDFLLYSLAHNYINRNYYPSKELLLTSIQTFQRRNLPQQQLEALFLLAKIYRKEQDLSSEVHTIENAVRIAKSEEDSEWLFYLYSYLGDMYIRQYNTLKFIKYQTLANQCLKDIDFQDISLLAQINVAKSFLYVGKYKESYDTLQTIESKVKKDNVYYNDIKRLQGIALFKMDLLDSCIDNLEEALNEEELSEHKFTCHSILTYCYYLKKDLENAERHKKLAIENNTDTGIGFTETEFYTICAEFAGENGNREEQIACLQNANRLYQTAIENIGGQSLNEAIQAYTNIQEKKAFHKRLSLYRYGVTGLLLALCVGLAIHIRRRKKQVYEVLALQKQINTLENLRNVKDEIKNFILRDFEIAKKIAMLRATQQTQSAKFLKDLDKYNIVKGNDLLATHWEQFYKHIDISFGGFHSKLTKEYPALNEKELQLCCMLVSGFKTEEIAAIWMNSVFSVHKYKTNVRKKINAPEGADIIAFLKEKLSLQ